MTDNSEAQQRQSRAPNNKRESKFRKRDPLFWPNLIKHVDPDLDKAATLALIETKYKQLYESQRQTQIKSETLEDLNAALTKSNGHCQSELAKSVLARARLENLCRELQKRNKMIHAESLTLIKAAEDKRMELRDKFTEKLTEITGMMEENEAKSTKMLGDNVQKTKNLIEVHERLQSSQEDAIKVANQWNLEREYHATLVQKMQIEANLQKASHDQEVAVLKEDLKKREQNCEAMLEKIAGLTEQVGVYRTQYKEFEATLSKNNVAFEGFRDMTVESNGRIAALEREAVAWKGKLHETVSNLEAVKGEKQTLSLELERAGKKIDKLQCLCRQLQVDRSTYLKMLRESGVEIDSNCDELRHEEDQPDERKEEVRRVESGEIHAETQENDVVQLSSEKGRNVDGVQEVTITSDSDIVK